MRAVTETFLAFLQQGFTAFGGPVSHVAHFRRAFVRKRNFLSEEAFAELLAMCSALPGPTSSQVAFGIGITRAGIAGGVAAWIGFTLPAAVMLATAGAILGAGSGATSIGHQLGHAGWVVGVKAFAVAVVAHAVWGMGHQFAASAPRAAFATLVAIGAFVAERLGGSWSAFAQPALIATGAAAGLLLGWSTAPTAGPQAAPDGGNPRVPRAAGVLAALLFAALVALAVFSPLAPPVARAGATCFGAGALVFGGGHVVLPLLERPFVEHGWLQADAVLAGYSLAQAAPGPLFAMAAFLGAAMCADAGPAASAAAAAFLTVAIFLPGMLLVVVAFPAWQRLRASDRVQRAIAGCCTAVVGILASALASPVIPAGIVDAWTASIAVASLALVAWGRVPVPAIAAAAALAGWLSP